MIGFLTDRQLVRRGVVCRSSMEVGGVILKIHRGPGARENPLLLWTVD